MENVSVSIRYYNQLHRTSEQSIVIVRKLCHYIRKRKFNFSYLFQQSSAQSYKSAANQYSPATLHKELLAMQAAAAAASASGSGHSSSRKSNQSSHKQHQPSTHHSSSAGHSSMGNHSSGRDSHHGSNSAKESSSKNSGSSLSTSLGE